jgi:ABC-2 type transport system permease protein
MRWHRLWAMARKEFIQIGRDSRSLIIVLVMPVVLVLLFGYGVSLDLKRTATCVFDREGSPQSRDLLARFASSEYFNVVKHVDGYPALTRALDTGACKLGVVVPHDFSRQLAAGGPVSVQAVVDATDDNTANLVFGYTEAVVRGFSAEVQLDWLARQGERRPAVMVRVESRTWFNEDLESKSFIVPGVVAIVMAVIGTFLTSLTIAREWERGTMEQLISTPVTSLEVMLGKLVPYFVIGMVATGVCVALGIGWFEVPFRGHWTTLFGSAALFLTVVLSIGFLFSVLAKTQLAASQFALVSTFLPSFLLSGFLFAIEQMPPVLRALTHLFPARYLVTILKAVFLKGTEAPALRFELAALGLFAMVLAALATRAFQKRLA